MVSYDLVVVLVLDIRMLVSEVTCKVGYGIAMDPVD
jgi:hypothetical protein